MSTEDKNAILSLLNDAKPIVAQIQNEEEAKRAKGENFNLFDIKWMSKIVRIGWNMR